MQEEYINIKAFRNSICAADDINFHRVEFKFAIDENLYSTIIKIEQHKEYNGYGGGIWAGSENNYKVIRTNNGEWQINKHVNLKEFFLNIKPFIKFERGSKKCKV